MDYNESYEQWLNDPCIDAADREELKAIKDEAEKEDRFYKELEFGTAGMRGVIGLGTNRMNKYVVARATQGLADYLSGIEGAAERGVVIAYDSRRFSAEFALEAALVLCGNSIRVNLFEKLHSVPQLSFAISHYGCGAGIVITASHNPKQYNGYKVYGANGAQIPPDAAQSVTECIDAVTNLKMVKRMSRDTAVMAGYLTFIGSSVDKAYYSYVKSLCVDPSVLAAAHDFKVVYTPLNGTGNEPVRRILRELGVENVFVVKDQENPDPDFSTVSAPNPEAPDAFNLAKALAEKVDADMLLATDPDADRLGVCVRDRAGAFVPLSGNQIGCLLMNYILSRKKQLGKLPNDAFVVKSIVSTTLADCIAADYGVELKTVLTGFRFIGELIDVSQTTKTGSFEFGFEESFGFLAGTRVRDKDAITAALLLTETAASYAARGMTVYEGLEELFDKYGYYMESIKNYVLTGKEGHEKISRAMAALREDVRYEFAGYRVVAVRDYAKSERTELKTGAVSEINLPKSNVIFYELEDGSWICVRPSGTEPKLKVYANGCAHSYDTARMKLDAMVDSLDVFLQNFLTVE